MPFDPSSLPPALASVFNNPWADTNMIFFAARDAGMTNVDQIADVMFYKLNPDLLLPGGSKPLNKGMPNYAALVKQWKGMRSIAQSLTPGFYGDPVKDSPAKSRKWSLYSDTNFAKSTTISDTVKKWMAEEPQSHVEVGLFDSNSIELGINRFFLVYKSADAKSTCVSHVGAHDTESLETFLEVETSISALARKPADPDVLRNMPVLPFGENRNTGFIGISLMNEAFNVRMLKYVFQKGMCLRAAHWRARRDALDDAHKLMDTASKVIGFAGGAKPGRSAGIPSSGKRPTVTGLKLNTSDSASVQLTKLGLKGYVKKWKNVLDPTQINERARVAIRANGLKSNRTIKNSGGAVVGVIRTFSK